MNGIEPEKKKNNLIRWVFGVLFLLLSLGMFSSSFIAGLLFLLAAVVSIPPAAKQLENKLNVRIPGVARFFVVFLLVVVAISATPSTSAPVNNTETIAAPPSTVSGSEAIAVPSEPAQVATPTPASAPTPTETPIKTLADKEPDSNYVTTDTPTSEASNYQDEAWKSSVVSQTTLLSDDMTKVSDAATNYNIDDLYKYSAKLTTDTKTALDESKSYSVSSSLQPSKEKYETALDDYNQGGYYGTIGASNLKNGNTAQGSQDLKLAASYLKSGTSNMNDATSLTNNLVNNLNSNTNTPSTISNAGLSEDTTRTSTTTSTGGTLYASSESNKYHSAGCRYVSKIKPEHLITFNSRQEAEAAGYSACSVCGG